MFVERHAVKRVHDARDSGEARGDASQETRLGGMRVNEIVTALLENAGDPGEGHEVLDRTGIAKQLGNDRGATVDFDGKSGELGTASGQDVDFVALAVHSEDGENGVLVGAATNEPRDDVSDADFARCAQASAPAGSCKTGAAAAGTKDRVCERSHQRSVNTAQRIFARSARPEVCSSYH